MILNEIYILYEVLAVHVGISKEQAEHRARYIAIYKARREAKRKAF